MESLESSLSISGIPAAEEMLLARCCLYRRPDGEFNSHHKVNVLNVWDFVGEDVTVGEMWKV